MRKAFACDTIGVQFDTEKGYFIMSIDMKTNDFTRPKYKGFSPVTKVERTLGARIVLGDYLKEIGLSQRSLAELCGLSQPAINDLCENRTLQFNLSYLVRVANVLQIDMNDIIRIVPIEEGADTYNYDTKEIDG